MSAHQMRRALLAVGELMGVDYDEDMPTASLCEAVVQLVADQQDEYHDWKRLYNDYVRANGVPGRKRRFRGARK